MFGVGWRGGSEKGETCVQTRVRRPTTLYRPHPLLPPTTTTTLHPLANVLSDSFIEQVNTIRIYTISMKTIKINRFKSFFNVENALTPRLHFISKNRPNLRSFYVVFMYNPTYVFLWLEPNDKPYNL